MPLGSRCGAGVRRPEAARPSWVRGSPPQPPAAGNLCRSHRTLDSPGLVLEAAPKADPWLRLRDLRQREDLDPGPQQPTKPDRHLAPRPGSVMPNPAELTVETTKSDLGMCQGRGDRGDWGRWPVHHTL